MPIDPITGRLVRERYQEPPDLFRNPDSSAVGSSRGFRLLDADDLILGVPRGVEGFLRGAVGLVADPIFGTDIGEERWLGRSDTLVGGAVEAITQFLIPFGAAQKGIKLARVAASAPAAVRGLANLTGAGGQIARAAVSGAAADFLAFDGHEERLSNLIQRVPGLRNPVTDFLEADQDDSELVGRLRNVLEGAALGVFADGIAEGLKAIRAARKARAAGNAAGARKADKEARTSGRVDPAVDAAIKATEEGKRAVKESLPPGVRPPERPRTAPPDEMTLGEALAAKTEISRLLLRKFRIEEADIPRLTEHFRDLVDRGDAQYLRGDPNKMPKELQAIIGLADTGALNLEHVLVDDDVATLIRAVERLMEEKAPPLKTRRPDAEAIVKQMQVARDILQTPSVDDPLATIRARVAQFDEGVEDLPMELHILIGSYANRANRLAEVLYNGPENVPPELLARLGVEEIAGDPERLLAEVLLAQNRTVEIAAHLSTVGGRWGRMGRFFQKDAEVVTDFVQGRVPLQGEASEILARHGLEEVKRRLEPLARMGDFGSTARMAAAMRLARGGSMTRAIAFTTEYAIHAMLSSPRTVVTNALFPTLTAFYVPFENMLGGALTFNGRVISRELRAIPGMLAALKDAGSAAARAFKENRSFLDPLASRQAELGLDQSLFNADVLRQAGIVQWGPDAPAAALINVLGGGLGFATRMMRTSDEFVKTFTARGYGYSLLTEQALARRAAGEAIDPTAYVAENMDRLFVDGQLLSEDLIKKRVDDLLRQAQLEGSGADIVQLRADLTKRVQEELNFEELNPISSRLLARAREVTATTPLTPGTLSHSAQEFVSRHPLLRLIAPFIRTPINLAKFVGQRDPGGAFTLPQVWTRRLFDAADAPALEAVRNRNVRALLSEDPDEKAEAFGRMAAGLGIFMGAAYAATQGLITGSGPDDQEQRRVLEDAGWVPYAINTGDKYVQFLRGDPFSTFLGLAADIVETTRFAAMERGEDQFSAVVLGLVSSAADNLTNKTYLTGVRAFFDAISRPERSGGAFLAQAAGLPFPRVFSQLRDVISDPVLKDTYGLVNKVRSRVPFLGEAGRPIPPARNVLGEPIRRTLGLWADPDTPASLWLDMFLPITYREVSDDEIRTELASLRHGFSPPPRTVLGVRPDDFVRGKQDAYDRWAELHGQVKINGRTIRHELRRLIRSKRYQELPSGSTPFEASPRVRMIRSVIGQYRRRAWEVTLREYPELSREVKRRRDAERALRAGARPSDFINDLDPFSFAR